MTDGSGRQRDREELAAESSAALLELVAIASTRPTTEVMEAVAHTLLETVGYRTVVLNVFRPEWNHFEAALVLGGQESREQLLGTCLSREVIDRLLADADRRLGAVHFLASGRSPVWDEVDSFYVPDMQTADAPDAWDPDDALLVLLADTDGEPLGLASMDEPNSGRRPTEADLGLIGLVCSYAEHALRLARRAETAEEEKRLLTTLSQVSPQMSATTRDEELGRLVADTLTGEFSFRRVAIYEHLGDDRLDLRVARGWEADGPLSPGASWRALTTILQGSEEEAGCHLLPSRELSGLTSVGAPPSSLNGRGPRGWSNHWLMVPWPDEFSTSGGVAILDDPQDRLIPSLELRGTLRLFMDLAVSIRDNARQRQSLHELASLDSLTGVRNRRDLEALISQHADAALLLCDIDHFKLINDHYGHDVGDRVLIAFGELLREFAGERGTAVRFGGDEFCLILAGIGEAEATAAAERLSRAAAQRLSAELPEPVLISVGVAVRAGAAPDSHALLLAADRDLYRVKRARETAAAPS